MSLFKVYAQTGNPDLLTGCGGDSYLPLSEISTMLIRGVGVLVPIGVIIFFIMLLVGGFKYVLASGDSKATEGAKGTITFGLVGLIILVSGWLILNLIGNQILLNKGAGGDIFTIQTDEIIRTIGGDKALSNPCIKKQ